MTRKRKRVGDSSCAILTKESTSGSLGADGRWFTVKIPRNLKFSGATFIALDNTDLLGTRTPKLDAKYKLRGFDGVMVRAGAPRPEGRVSWLGPGPTGRVLKEMHSVVVAIPMQYCPKEEIDRLRKLAAAPARSHLHFIRTAAEVARVREFDRGLGVERRRCARARRLALRPIGTVGRHVANRSNAAANDTKATQRRRRERRSAIGQQQQTRKYSRRSRAACNQGPQPVSMGA